MACLPLCGISSFSQMSWSSPCIIRADVAGSALMASGGMLSGQGAFPTLIFVMALDISSVVVWLMFICSSSPASMSGGCSTGFPDRRRLKCSFQRSSWSTGLMSVPPSSSRTGLSELDLLLVISYSVLLSLLVAASCTLDASWSILLLLSWRVLLLTSFCCSLYSFWTACVCALVLAWRSRLLMVLRSSIFAMVSLLSQLL